MARLDEVRIRVGEDGSHSVRHSFKSEPKLRSGRMNGGLETTYPRDEEHNFGPTPAEHKRLQAHLTETLKLGGKSKATAESAAPGAGAAAAEEDD